jgi:hypothetical protein
MRKAEIADALCKAMDVLHAQSVIMRRMSDVLAAAQADLDLARQRTIELVKN